MIEGRSFVARWCEGAEDRLVTREASLGERGISENDYDSGEVC